jgi:hypothetical protein
MGYTVHGALRSLVGIIICRLRTCVRSSLAFFSAANKRSGANARSTNHWKIGIGQASPLLIGTAVYRPYRLLLRNRIKTTTVLLKCGILHTFYIWLIYNIFYYKGNTLPRGGWAPVARLPWSHLLIINLWHYQHWTETCIDYETAFSITQTSEHTLLYADLRPGLFKRST